MAFVKIRQAFVLNMRTAASVANLQ